MSILHFLNVSPGDCTVIQHNSGRVSIIDICCGNLPLSQKTITDLIEQAAVRGNFRMCERSTNPLEYLGGLDIDSIFRFILTHPDMDHMDGFDALLSAHTLANYWDSGVRKEKPAFAQQSRYKEADWDRYVQVRDGNGGATVINARSGSKFKFANRLEDGTDGGDGLHVLAPDQSLVDAANSGDDCNDGSYVLLYKSVGGDIIIPGDAHDCTWEYVLSHYPEVSDVKLLIAPHHGRGSGRSYDFLDKLNPKLTLFGCAPSKDLDYNAWNNRGLEKITSNQAGNVVLDCHEQGIDVYVENEVFARKYRSDTDRKNGQGYRWIKRL